MIGAWKGLTKRFQNATHSRLTDYRTLCRRTRCRLCESHYKHSDTADDLGQPVAPSTGSRAGAGFIAANGARIRLAPQRDWEVNKPEQLSRILDIYGTIADEVGASIADIIVLAGNVGIEQASGISIPFTSGRGDASQEQTDVDSFAMLEPLSDAFRNFHNPGLQSTPEDMLLDKAQLLGLTAPEMTALLGGMRSMGISASGHGLFTDDPNTLSSDYFQTLLDMSVAWQPNGTGNSFEAMHRVSGEKMRSATRADLVFGSNSQLRALTEVYASNGSEEKFISAFVGAWTKVMNADLF